MSHYRYLTKISKELYNDLQNKRLDSSYLKSLSKKYPQLIEYDEEMDYFNFKTLEYVFPNCVIEDKISEYDNLTNDKIFNEKNQGDRFFKILSKEQFEEYYERAKAQAIIQKTYDCTLFNIYTFFNKAWRVGGENQELQKEWEEIKKRIKEEGKDFERMIRNFIRLADFYYHIHEKDLKLFFSKYESFYKVNYSLTYHHLKSHSLKNNDYLGLSFSNCEFQEENAILFNLEHIYKTTDFEKEILVLL